MNNLDPTLKNLFDQAGISENHLNDEETANFIYDFIEQRGGLDAIKREQAAPTRPLRTTGENVKLNNGGILSTIRPTYCYFSSI